MYYTGCELIYNSPVGLSLICTKQYSEILQQLGCHFRDTISAHEYYADGSLYSINDWYNFLSLENYTMPLSMLVFS